MASTRVQRIRAFCIAALAITLAHSASLDKSSCGSRKNCFFSHKDCDPAKDCALGISYVMLNSSFLELELVATLANTSSKDGSAFYVAVGFSHDSRMGDDFVTECSSLGAGAKLSAKASFNVFKKNVEGRVRPTNVRIANEEKARARLFSSEVATVTDGVVYCHVIQRISDVPTELGPEGFSLNSTSAEFYLLLAKGDANDAGLLTHHKNRATSPKTKLILTGAATMAFQNLSLLAAFLFVLQSRLSP